MRRLAEENHLKNDLPAFCKEKMMFREFNAEKENYVKHNSCSKQTIADV